MPILTEKFVFLRCKSPAPRVPAENIVVKTQTTLYGRNDLARSNNLHRFRLSFWGGTNKSVWFKCILYGISAKPAFMYCLNNNSDTSPARLLSAWKKVQPTEKYYSKFACNLRKWPTKTMITDNEKKRATTTIVQEQYQTCACVVQQFNAFANDYIFGMFNNETENVRQAATVRYQFEKS